MQSPEEPGMQFDGNLPPQFQSFVENIFEAMGILSLAIPSFAFLIPVVVLMIIYLQRSYLPARKRRKARLTGPRRITIGTIALTDQPMWVAGFYVPIQETFLNLVKVDLIPTDPQILRFRRKHIELRQSSWHDRVQIPVPGGRENEARELVQRFRAETIPSKHRSFAPAEPV